MATSRRLGALLGVVSAAAGLAVSELLSGLLHQRVSPVVAVAESVIGITPGSVVEFVISVVGTNDKPFLIAATLVGLTLVSAAVGVLAMRSVLAAQSVFFLMGVVLTLAVHARLTSSSTTYVPAVLGVVTAIACIALLAPTAAKAVHRRSRRVHVDDVEVEASPARDVSRRRFLALAGAVMVGSVLVAGAGRILAHSRAAVEAARGKLRLAVRAKATPAGAELGVKGIVPWTTTDADFYRIDTALSIPQILPDNWRLRIHGKVDKELTLTYRDLVDRGLDEAWVTLCCVSNQVGGDLISNAWWSGVRIAGVLAEAGVHDDADAVLSTSDDGWTCGTPLAALTDDRNAMFAVAMNGKPLSPEHGFPVRMVVPGLYGYVSATKWVVDLEVTSFGDFSAFWTNRGWSEQGPIKTQSRIDVPRDGARRAEGEVAIGGIAWAQHTGISKVEVRVDDGDWVEATLGTDASIDAWCQWSLMWQASVGEHELAVRATDKAGYTQTSDVADVLPNGATGWHTISVKVD